MASVSKAKKKNIPKSINEMSKEMLQETLKKKRECNAKALTTVEKLCEANVDEEWFLDNLQFINQCHFDDAIVERAITKICGYPLCNQQLDKIPAQQYHISTKYNKVFDITERKNFCSSTCYKSAVYVKKQLFTSPLWFRDQEVIPKYTVLKSSKSLFGEEIVFEDVRIKLEPNKMKKSNSVDKVSDVHDSINEVEKLCRNIKLEDSQKDVDKTKTNTVENKMHCSDEITDSNFDKKITVLEKESNEVESYSTNNADIEDKIIDNQKNNCAETISTVEKGSNEIKKTLKENAVIEDKAFKKSKNSELKVSDETKTKVKLQTEPVDVISKIEKCIFEWFSLDTLFYLYGEEKLKEMFQDKAVRIKEIINSRLSVAGYNEKIDKIIKLYGLLDNDLLTKNEIKTNLKPLPDYSVLKEEGKTLQIKVRAFYQGQLEVKAAEKEEKKEEEETKTDSDPIYLPLVDAHAQNALRRKIVLDKLNRVLPELIRVFNSNYILQMNEVRNLVSTFALAAHNIVFKPREWYLVGVILLKLLCLKNRQLELLMNSKSAESQIILILMSYQLKSNYLDDLLQRLTDDSNIMLKLTDINS